MDTDNIRNKYHDCFECGGTCCKFFGVPLADRNRIYTTGVLIEMYRDKNELNPRRYFELHRGIRITEDGKCFIADSDVKTRLISTRLGIQLIVYSTCTKLGDNARCTIYDTRPDMCRSFDEQTVEFYHVPEGCIYDTGGFGENFGI
ncbi:YkgJ family cysteine cluster protein [Candidatus Latescibacterota bacterium]